MNLDFEKPVAELEKKIEELRELGKKSDANFTAEIRELSKRCQRHRQEIYSKLTAFQTLQIARHPERPVLQDYISLMFDEFVECHGDRFAGDDRGLIGGFARLGGRKVMLIGHNRGKTPEENMACNFGMAKPEGYRKALRLMRLAEKFGLPVLCFIDTMGAYPGLEAEERGQAEAIAKNLTEMSRLSVPIVVLVTGEGGSGGALGIGVGDVLLMLSYSVYSVISPEGGASILWRDAAYAPQAAEALKITAPSLKSLGIIDEVITEPIGGAHRDYEHTAASVKAALGKHLDQLGRVPKSKLLNRRFEKYSKMGKYAG